VNRFVTELSGVRATALLSLYARAFDNGSAHPILGDRWAKEIITRLDFDFTRFRTAKKERYGVGVRTRQMDEWTRDFVTSHPDAIVLDLGAGLDSRVFRVNPPSTVSLV
jgi:O-methyltransferase involved in polyketide biosynthesis